MTSRDAPGTGPCDWAPAAVAALAIVAGLSARGETVVLGKSSVVASH